MYLHKLVSSQDVTARADMCFNSSTLDHMLEALKGFHIPSQCCS